MIYPPYFIPGFQNHIEFSENVTPSEDATNIGNLETVDKLKNKEYLPPSFITHDPTIGSVVDNLKDKEYNPILINNKGPINSRLDDLFELHDAALPWNKPKDTDRLSPLSYIIPNKEFYNSEHTNIPTKDSLIVPQETMTENIDVPESEVLDRVGYIVITDSPTDVETVKDSITSNEPSKYPEPDQNVEKCKTGADDELLNSINTNLSNLTSSCLPFPSPGLFNTWNYSRCIYLLSDLQTDIEEYIQYSKECTRDEKKQRCLTRLESCKTPNPRYIQNNSTLITTLDECFKEYTTCIEPHRYDFDSRKPYEKFESQSEDLLPDEFKFECYKVPQQDEYTGSGEKIYSVRRQVCPWDLGRPGFFGEFKWTIQEKGDFFPEKNWWYEHDRIEQVGDDPLHYEGLLSGEQHVPLNLILKDGSITYIPFTKEQCIEKALDSKLFGDGRVEGLTYFTGNHACFMHKYSTGSKFYTDMDRYIPIEVIEGTPKQIVQIPTGTNVREACSQAYHPDYKCISEKNRYVPSTCDVTQTEVIDNLELDQCHDQFRALDYDVYDKNSNQLTFDCAHFYDVCSCVDTDLDNVECGEGAPCCKSNHSCINGTCKPDSYTKYQKVYACGPWKELECPYSGEEMSCREYFDCLDAHGYHGDSTGGCGIENMYKKCGYKNNCIGGDTVCGQVRYDGTENLDPDGCCRDMTCARNPGSFVMTCQKKK